VPGIVGLITGMPQAWAKPRLQQMVQTLRHEPFYVTGTWCDESLGTYAGWVVRKNTRSERMPLRNRTDDVLLVFSGEEYSESKEPYDSKDHCDGENALAYLLQFYERDPGFPAGLNGRFQGLLVDRRQRRSILFNDRYGMERLYYHQSKEAFYFAAEAKAILAVCPELRAADHQSLGELVACGCVLQNRSLFKGIYVLPPASAWGFRNGSLERKGAYFNPQEWENQAVLKQDIFYQQLVEIFGRTLPKYFNGPEPIGMSLTGGLDTRMIMAWQKAAPDSLPCYTFGGPFRDCQDIVVARRVARACQQSHTVIPIGTEFFSRFHHYAERTVYMTDGCVAVNHSADLYANSRAREIAPVRMTGNYGGEVLRRVRAFKPVEPLSGLFPELAPYTRQARHTYASLVQGHPLSFAVFQQAPWHHYGLLSLEQTQLTLRTPFLDNDLVQTVFRAPVSACAEDVSLRLIAQGDTSLRKIPTDRGVGGNGTRLSGALRRQLHNFTFKAEYAYDASMPQWMARVDHAFSALHLERLFLGRHKFLHFRVWYRDILSSYVREILLDGRSLARPYIGRAALKNVVHGHLENGRNYTSEINTALTLELIHRLFFDAK